MQDRKTEATGFKPTHAWAGLEVCNYFRTHAPGEDCDFELEEQETEISCGWAKKFPHTPATKCPFLPGRGKQR